MGRSAGYAFGPQFARTSSEGRLSGMIGAMPSVGDQLDLFELIHVAAELLRQGESSRAGRLLTDACARFSPSGKRWHHRRTLRVPLTSGTTAASAYESALDLYVPAHAVVVPTAEVAASPVDCISLASSPRPIEPVSFRPGVRPQVATAAPISIHVLGGFDLIIDGVRFSSGVKPQRKPLELLKVLLLSNGEPLGAVELADRLWPDSDGDTGRNSLQVAVHRLRRLLRCEPALIMQDRKLRLDGRLCWVDVWAFEREAHELSDLPVGSSQFAERAIQILRLYRGHLFAHEPEQQWMLAARDRVRRCWLDLVRRLGQDHELRDEWSRACTLYQRTLDLDPLEEETYRRLMLCQQKVGERIQALNTYLRCRQQLSAGLGVKPSQETERLYQTLRNAA